MFSQNKQNLIFQVAVQLQLKACKIFRHKIVKQLGREVGKTMLSQIKPQKKGRLRASLPSEALYLDLLNTRIL